MAVGDVDGDVTLGAAGSAAPRERFAVGSFVAGRYRVLRFIAAGGMGEVYAVHDAVLDTAVALKTLRPELEGSADAIARLRREIALARNVTNAHVCRLHDVGEHDGRVFLTMELLDGRTLAEVVRDGSLAVDRVEEIATQLADGLAALHRAQIVHRDFKTSNVILVGADGERAVITDFGLARSTDAGDSRITLTTEASMIGTPAYMAPEQVEARPATQASDIYAFGVVLFELLTGVLPFRESTAMATATARLHRDPPRPSAVNPRVPARWDALVLRCLARDPYARFARIDDVLAYRPVSRRWLLGAGAAAVLAGGLGIWRLRPRTSAVTATFGERDIVAVLPVGGAAGLFDDPWRLALTFDIHHTLATSGVPHLSIHTGNMRRTLEGAAMAVSEERDPVAAALALPQVTTVVQMLLAEQTQAALVLDVRGSGGVLAGWSQRFSRPRAEASFLVDDVAAAIARRLGAAPPRTGADNATLTAELYEQWGRALGAYYRPLTNEQIDAFRRGDAPPPFKPLADLVDARPSVVRATALIADRLVMAAEQDENLADSEAKLVRADALVTQILAVDAQHALALAVAGHAAMLRWRWREADELTKRAYELAPTHTRVEYHRNFLEMMLGRFDSAVAHAERKHARNPGAQHGTALAWHYFYARRFPDVIRVVEPVIDRLDPKDTFDAITLGLLVNAYAELARFDDAMALAERMRKQQVDNYALGNAVGAYVLAGRTDEAKAIRDEIGDDIDLGQRWLIHDALGDIDAAIADLERVLAARNIHALFIKIERISARLRSDPRYQAMLTRVGFIA